MSHEHHRALAAVAGVFSARDNHVAERRDGVARAEHEETPPVHPLRVATQQLR